MSPLPTPEYEFVVKVEKNLQLHGPIIRAREKDSFFWESVAAGWKRIFFSLFFCGSLFASRIQSLAATTDEVFHVSNIFKPHSVPAHTIYNLSLLVLAICAAIFIAVTAVLVFVVVRYRRQVPTDTQEPPQIYGSSQIELAWTIIPILITIVLILATARTIGDIQDKQLPEDALTIKIVGHQWWWEVRYPQHGFITANEIHVPVSSSSHSLPTRIILESADVLHSFWVPQLAGKMQLVPNKTNITWIEPLKTGVYLGNCAQYCGTQHAFMLLRVIVHPPEEFKQWLASQKKPAQSLVSAAAGIAATIAPNSSSSDVPQEITSREEIPKTPEAVRKKSGEMQKTEAQKTPSPLATPATVQQTPSNPPLATLAAEGQKTFAAVACVNCHRIDGTSAQGVFGPDLTHFMSRETLGAGIAANNHKNLWQWIRNPQLLKIGCLMPDMQLTDRQVDEIVAYLETLK